MKGLLRLLGKIVKENFRFSTVVLFDVMALLLSALNILKPLVLLLSF